MPNIFIPRCLLSAVCACVVFGVPVQAQQQTKTAQSAEALRQLGVAYEHGEGVVRNPEEAHVLYCQAARMGDALAQYNLGWMYANGRGVERDDAAAAYFFQAAAEQGLSQAQRMLSLVGGTAVAVPGCLKPVPLVGMSSSLTLGQKAHAPKPVNYEVVAPKHILKLVRQLAPKYQVDTQLALAIIAAESNFNPQAVSSRNAQGLMQLIPETSERFNVKDAFDPAQNIRGGLRYLRWLLAYFEGNVALVAAAYNAGEGKVERYKGVPPYQETRKYVTRILHAVGDTAHPFDHRVTKPSPVIKVLSPPPTQ